MEKTMKVSNSIKPIETIYNGYRFRSRLEARWAVFFDTLGIQYEYEPEGFKLSDGTICLPDFYLPAFDYYVEIKGFSKHLRSDLDKVENFVHEIKKSVAILSEIPYSEEAAGMYWFPVIHYCSAYHNYADKCYFLFMYNDGGAYIEDGFYIGHNEHWLWHTANVANADVLAYKNIQAIPGEKLNDKDCDIRIAFDFSKINKALLKSRQARFEHGDKPIT